MGWDEATTDPRRTATVPVTAAATDLIAQFIDVLLAVERP
jgi:hypothetical protein